MRFEHFLAVATSAMRPFVVGFSLAQALFLFPLVSGAAETLLDFEDLPRFTLVQNQYSPRGVRFVHEGADVAAQGKIMDFALGDFGIEDFGSSPTQSLVIGSLGGTTTAVFVNTVTGNPHSTNFFSIRAGDGDRFAESFRVTAFDSQGASIFQQDYTTGQGTTAGGVTVSLSSADIARVAFMHLPSDSGFNIDDLRFNAIPEPATAILTLAAIGAGAIALRRRAKARNT